MRQIGNSEFNKNNTKYRCDKCGHQVASKQGLMRHKMSVHDGVKHLCRHCKHQTTSKAGLTRHQRAVHEGVKYPCRLCSYRVFQVHCQKVGAYYSGLKAT